MLVVQDGGVKGKIALDCHMLHGDRIAVTSHTSPAISRKAPRLDPTFTSRQPWHLNRHPEGCVQASLKDSSEQSASTPQLGSRLASRIAVA